MRLVVWLVLLFAAAVVAATALGRNDALVTFFWGGWRLDMSLNLFIVAALVTLTVIAFSLRALGALVSLPERARAWRALARERTANAALRQAMAEFFAARYSRAQKAAQRALQWDPAEEGAPDDPEFRMLAHAIAAASAHRLQDRPRRDEQLQAARALGPRDGRAVDDGLRLLALEWALDDRDVARVDELLAQMPAGVARRTQALRLRLQAARLRGQPTEALQVARLLANHQGFTPQAGRSLLRSLAIESLDQARDTEQLRRAWLAFDAQDRRDAFIAARAATRLAAFGAHAEARDLLLPHWDALARLPSDERNVLCAALSAAIEGIGADWLPRLEAAAAQFPADPAVQAAVGVGFAERQLWGKARRLLDHAAGADTLAPRARRQSLRWLARIARHEGDEAAALGFEQRAAALD
jgi:HemY protein